MQEKIQANGYEMPNAICLVIHYHTLWYLLSLSQQRCQGISLTSEKDRGMGWGDCNSVSFTQWVQLLGDMI